MSALLFCGHNAKAGIRIRDATISALLGQDFGDPVFGRSSAISPKGEGENPWASPEVYTLVEEERRW